MSDDTLRALEKLAVKAFGPAAEGLGPDVDFFDALGIDSLKALALLSEVELAFDIELPDYELQGVTTLAALAAKVDERR
jgi:acyl carrier protein